MAYGNVTPPTLPTYDVETNGFYLLVFNYELGAESWYMVHLIYGAWRFQYEEGVGITNTGNTFTRTYSDGVWSEESQNTVALALNPGVNGQVYQRIYTNANIFNGDELWLAENTVTPLDEEQRQINMKSQLAGFLASWVSRVRQFPQRDPVAFLYGHVAKEGETPTHNVGGVDYVGVVAPKLPVVGDNFMVCMARSALDKVLNLHFTTTPVFVRKASDGSYQEAYVQSNGTEIRYSINTFKGETDWTYRETKDYVSGDRIIDLRPLSLAWTTNPIINTDDGSVYCEVCDQIPIYE